MLRSRLPLVPQRIATMLHPFDLHALDTPPAFILSQDQTLSYSALLAKSLCLVTVLTNSIGGRCNHVIVHYMMGWLLFFSCEDTTSAEWKTTNECGGRVMEWEKAVKRIDARKMWMKRGFPRLVDFGLAPSQTSSTYNVVRLGTFLAARPNSSQTRKSSIPFPDDQRRPSAKLLLLHDFRIKAPVEPQVPPRHSSPAFWYRRRA